MKKICKLVLLLMVIHPITYAEEFSFKNFSTEKTRIYDVIIPFSAAGPSDVMWRNLEPIINENLKKDNIHLKIKNVPGAGGSIGLQELLNSKNLTFGFFSSFFAINKFTRIGQYNYNFDSLNFLNFAGYTRMHILSFKHPNLESLKNYCSDKNEIFYGSSGRGSTSELLGYYFAKKYLNCEKITVVPYKTTTLAYADVRSKLLDFIADFSITSSGGTDNLFLIKIYEFSDHDVKPWHIFVSNINNKDSEIVKRVFSDLKNNKTFTSQIEEKFQLINFSEHKDSKWLKQEFNNFELLIKSLEK